MKEKGEVKEKGGKIVIKKVSLLVDDGDWREFRVIAVRAGKTLQSYLGELITERVKAIKKQQTIKGDL